MYHDAGVPHAFKWTYDVNVSSAPIGVCSHLLRPTCGMTGMHPFQVMLHTFHLQQYAMHLLAVSAHAGGNSAQCLQHVWDEFHEAVRAWLHGQGQALPPSGPQLAAGHRHQRSTGAAGSLDRAAYVSVLRAFLALESGAAGGQLLLSQVAVDRILGLGRDAFAGLKALLAREDANVAAAVEALASQPELPGLLGLPADEVAALSDADVVALLLASPTLRGELRLVKSVESEPDTDGEDAGGEATDMDDSD